MGGPGSGRPAETYAERLARLSNPDAPRRGRKLGGHNTPEGCAAIRAGMLAACEIKRHRPGVCDECKRPPDGRDSLEWFQRRWLCCSCLADEMEPLRNEDFVYTGTSCLGDAGECHAMESGHGHGPTGDAALSTATTRAAREKRRSA
jgi:hypothetical protein